MAATPDGTTEPSGNEHITSLCIALKPRYHFASSPDFFFEREPFFHVPTAGEPDARPISRFISLAAHGNTSKQKSHYAFSLKPPDPAAPLPVGTTASPWISRSHPKKRRALDPAPYSRYANNDHQPNKYKRGKGRNGERLPPAQKDCFFCLSNTTAELHLVASIGSEAYLTTCKGPLITSTTYAPLGVSFPAHMLIIPCSHSPTIDLITEDEDENKGMREKTFKEMSQYKEAVQDMIADHSNNKLGAVTYEISMARGVHIHWQIIAIPEDLIHRGLIEAAFRVEAENHSYPAFAEGDPGIGQDAGDFLRVWIWTPPSEENDKGSTKCLTLPIEENTRFDIQFGRHAIAKLLGLEKRLDWKECAQTTEEETKDRDIFKDAFRVFDFTATE